MPRRFQLSPHWCYSSWDPRCQVRGHSWPAWWCEIQLDLQQISWRTSGSRFTSHPFGPNQCPSVHSRIGSRLWDLGMLGEQQHRPAESSMSVPHSCG